MLDGGGFARREMPLLVVEAWTSIIGCPSSMPRNIKECCFGIAGVIVLLLDSTIVANGNCLSQQQPNWMLL
jgi:hypothetical protein